MSKNMFLDYSIILNSNPKNILIELDKLIINGYELFLWSKEYSPEDMKYFCHTTKIPVNQVQQLEHELVKYYRSERKSYQEISELLKISISKISYYANTEIFKFWYLNDWFKGYFKKDSTNYQKADFICDPDPKFVKKFTDQGIQGLILKTID